MFAGQKLLLLDPRTGATRRTVKTRGLAPSSIATTGGRVRAIDWNGSTLAAHDDADGFANAAGHVWIADVVNGEISAPS